MAKKTVTLGTWDNKPIEWIILKEDNYKMLAISRACLFNSVFDSSGNSKWSESTIRAYLNGEFFSKAFNFEEKKKIVNVYLEDPNKTKDDVFLLSKTEAANLMTVEERNKKYWWWLRSPYDRERSVAVSSNGEISYNGVIYREYIHPAIYIKK